MARRHGSLTAFWNAEATGVNGTSEEIEIGRSSENLTVFVTVDGATTVKVQVGHSGGDKTDGTGVDAAPTVWHDLYALTTQVATTFGGAGSRAIQIPDCSFGWVRLHSSANVTATAGYEAAGDR